ncbi:MAG: PepSY-like domain-containing protein [Prevotellaceae bacterium]|nr:PepSY-like domain-containing protein [Prevotellaceae bacterium]
MDIGDGDYEAILKEGIEIDFRSNGEWESVKSRNGVPASCVPIEISNYVKANYPNRTIVKISRKRSGNIEIELGGIRDLELLFDANGKFIRTDN